MSTLYQFKKQIVSCFLFLLAGFGLITPSLAGGNKSLLEYHSEIKPTPTIPSLGDFLNKETEEKPLVPLKKLTITGFYRALVYTRTMDDAYTKALEPMRALSIADGYREPMLNLNIGAAPTKDTYFNYQMFFLPMYTGPINKTTKLIDSTTRILSLQFGVTLSGTIKTKLGKYEIVMGGSNWQRISQLTLWQNEGFNRFSTFDRRPWDDPTSTARYKDFNEQGTINQDVRWGRRPFQGVFIEGTGLPKKVGLVFFYGKTDNNGGGLSFLNPTFPDQFIGGKISKSFGKNSIAFNTFNRTANKSEVKDIFLGYDVQSLQYVYFLKTIKLSGEVGIGSYTSPTHPQKYSEAINLGILIPKKYTFLPLNIQLFQVGANYINLNSIVYNTSLLEAQQQSGLANSQSIFPFNSPIVEIGQLTNNRKGVNLNTEFKVGKLRVNLGYGNTMELQQLNHGISYNHRINALAVSRINPFAAGIGPYGRLNTMFRGYYESVNLTDSSSNKHFNTFEVQGKYGSKFLKKDVFIFYTGYFNSVQPMFSLFNKLNDDAYIRVISNEFDLYYNIIPKVMVVGYYGLEHVMGNKYTDVNTSNPNTISYDTKTIHKPSYMPRNQIGQGIGFGFDFDLGKDIGLYYRQRWMTYEDMNFADDHYKGVEATVEIKATF
jgi:hypothetical protein